MSMPQHSRVGRFRLRPHLMTRLGVLKPSAVTCAARQDACRAAVASMPIISRACLATGVVPVGRAARVACFSLAKLSIPC